MPLPNQLIHRERGRTREPSSSRPIKLSECGARSSVAFQAIDRQYLLVAKLFLLALGSRGDVQPFVALAAGLQGAGHDVVLATPEGFTKLMAGRNFTHVEVMSSPESLLGAPDDELVR